MSNELAFSYAWEREDKEFINSLNDAPMRSSEWENFSRPPEVTVEWHKTENQGQIGSCQGNSLSSVLERLAHVRGEILQLSKIFGYLATQRIDGLLGSDNGSTISGGAKLALQTGVCPENLTGYPSRYPGLSDRNRILSQANYDASAPFKALSSWKAPRNHEDTLNFIGGGGGINFGIRWYNGFLPSDRVVRSYNPRLGGGGHANCILGYDRNGNYRALNSWGDGPYLITPQAWDQILAAQYTTAIGLMGTKEATPINWHQDSPYFKLNQ